MIEMLLVLAVLMTVIGIAIPTYRTAEAEKEEQRFFDVLLHDIYFAQSESYKTESSVMVVFRGDGRSYEIVRNVHEPLIVRTMPASVSFDKASNITNIYFNPAASIINPGTLRFRTSTGVKTIVVHLGKGRVVISG